jgi:hypothetical protein
MGLSIGSGALDHAKGTVIENTRKEGLGTAQH